MKESTFWKIFYAAIAGLVAAVLCLVFLVEPKKTEYDMIRAIIEDISDYRTEIESWGYQVSILPRLEEEPPEQGFKHYYWNHAGPVLVLTDKNGGNWCFYSGFDQYFTQLTRTDTVKPLYSDDEAVEANKTVDLQIFKRQIGKLALRENATISEAKPYYDVEVDLQIRAFSVETGEELSLWDGGRHHCYYCSGDFAEGWLGETSFVDMEKKARYADRSIKNEVGAERLAEYYRRGLELEDRLIQLYQNTIDLKNG